MRALDEQTLGNVADVRGDSHDPDTSNNHARVEHIVEATSDVQVNIDDSGDFVAGGEFRYALYVSNEGPSPARSVHLVDTLPPGLTLTRIEVVDGPADCHTTRTGDDETVVECGFGNLAVADTQRVDLVVAVDPRLLAASQLTNGATVTSDNFDPDNSNNYNTEISQVKALSNLSLQKSADRATVAAGETVEYTIRVRNDGPSLLRNLDVVDLLHENGRYLGLAHFTIEPPSPGVCFLESVQMPAVRCHLGDVAAGVEYRIDLQMIVSSTTPAGTQLVNEVQVEADSPVGRLEGVRRAEVAVTAEAVLLATKTASTVAPAAGETFAYVVRVVNRGPSLARRVVVRDQLPAEVEYLQATVPGCPNACAVGDVAAGSSAELVITVRLRPETASSDTPIVNNLSLAADTPIRGLRLVTDTANILPVSRADVNVQMAGAPGSVVTAGRPYVYTMRVENSGPSAAQQVQDGEPVGVACAVHRDVARWLHSRGPAPMPTIGSFSAPSVWLRRGRTMS